MLSVSETDGRAQIRNEGRKNKVLSLVYVVRLLIYRSLKHKRVRTAHVSELLGGEFTSLMDSLIRAITVKFVNLSVRKLV
jgi:hypothetical protein